MTMNTDPLYRYPSAPDPKAPYTFPSQGERKAWEDAVCDAISGKHTLTWRRMTDKQWALAGDCPRCGHRMSNYVDVEVIVSQDFFGPTAFGSVGAAAPEKFTTEVICNCRTDPPHKKDTNGCGYGRSLEIEIPFPR